MNDLTTAYDAANGALTRAQGYTAPTGTSANPMLSFNNTVGAAGNTLAANGSGAAATGLSDLTGFNPSATNNPQAIEDAAASYVKGQNIPAEVAQATQMANQTANQVTLPQITQNANTSGNADSSRTGIAQGIVQQGLAENAQNEAGALSSQAYQNGLTLAENEANANNTASLTAATNAANAGTNATGTGTNAVSNSITNVGNSNAVNQNNFTNGVNDSYAPLQDYMNLIGSTNWGNTTNTNTNSTSSGTGTSQTQSDPSAFSLIAGLLGAGAGAYKAFG